MTGCTSRGMTGCTSKGMTGCTSRGMTGCTSRGMTECTRRGSSKILSQSAATESDLDHACNILQLKVLVVLVVSNELILREDNFKVTGNPFRLIAFILQLTVHAVTLEFFFIVTDENHVNTPIVLRHDVIYSRLCSHDAPQFY